MTTRAPGARGPRGPAVVITPNECATMRRTLEKAGGREGTDFATLAGLEQFQKLPVASPCATALEQCKARGESTADTAVAHRGVAEAAPAEPTAG